MSTVDARLQGLVTLYETLSPEDLDRLVARYAERCRFKDPFNEVQGRAAVRQIFDHMFRTVRGPRFVVREAFAAGDQAFLAWDFHAGDLVIRGASHLRFDATGLVADHRDYWDAAEELYEKLPVLGVVMRLLKRRLKAT